MSRKPCLRKLRTATGPRLDHDDDSLNSTGHEAVPAALRAGWTAAYPHKNDDEDEELA